MTLNDIIRRYQLDTRELSKICGVTFGNIRKIIKGERIGNFSIYLRLQRAFRLSDADIYDIYCERSIAYERHIEETKRG